MTPGDHQLYDFGRLPRCDDLSLELVTMSYFGLVLILDKRLSIRYIFPSSDFCISTCRKVTMGSDHTFHWTDGRWSRWTMVGRKY